MTQHNDLIRLQHMLDHAKEAIDLIAGKDKAELQRDRVLELALIRLVEVVGEACAKVSSLTQLKCPSIPWPQIIGMRNRRHATNGVSAFTPYEIGIGFAELNATHRFHFGQIHASITGTHDEHRPILFDITEYQ